MAKRGGGLFRTAPDPITGATKLTTLSIILILLLVVGIVLAIVLPLTLLKKDETKDDPVEPKSGGAVAPGMSKLPGRITIAEVAQSPSAGQAIIYFSQAQASGTTCEDCTTIFDVNITYVGGKPPQNPTFQKVTAPSTSGTVTFEYAVSAGGFSPVQPGGDMTSPPTEIQLEIAARSVNSQGSSSSPTIFSKTLPYVA